jgi:hypothetical protein
VQLRPVRSLDLQPQQLQVPQARSASSQLAQATCGRDMHIAPAVRAHGLTRDLGMVYVKRAQELQL